MRKTQNILVLIFLLVLFARLYFVFQTPDFDNSGYLVKRYVESIIETGKPITHDTLSYNGRDVLYSPLYYYILALFSMLLGVVFTLKLIPSIFISSLVFVVYLLSKKIISNDSLALFLALMSGFIPVVFSDTLLNASIYTLVVPIMFYLVYLFISLDEDKKYINRFILFTFLLNFLHPSAFLFSIGLLFYFVLSNTEKVKLSNLKEEAMILNLVATFFIQFLIYKKAFLEYGFSVIWNNVPYQILGDYFNFNILGMLYRVGTLIAIFGLIGIILGIVNKKQNLFFISSFSLAIFIPLWLRLIEPKVGLIFLSTSLLIASAFTFNLFLNYLQKTKLPNYRLSFLIIVIFLIVVSLAVPSFVFAQKNVVENVPTPYEKLVLNWIKENALPDVTVVSPLGKGHYVSGIAKKRTVMDDNFLLAPDTSERYKDIKLLYSTKSEVTALEIIKKYNIDYIFIPVETELENGRIVWTDDTGCFKGIFFGTPKVYQVVC